MVTVHARRAIGILVAADLAPQLVAAAGLVAAGLVAAGRSLDQSGCARFLSEFLLQSRWRPEPFERFELTVTECRRSAGCGITR